MGWEAFSSLGTREVQVWREGGSRSLWESLRVYRTRDRVAIKLVQCKSGEEVNWAASEMHIVMTISGHRNVVSLIEAFYSDGMLVESTKVA